MRLFYISIKIFLEISNKGR